MFLGIVYKLFGYFAVGLAMAIIIKNFVVYGVFFCAFATALFSLLLAIDKEKGVTINKAILSTAIAASVVGIII